MNNPVSLPTNEFSVNLIQVQQYPDGTREFQICLNGQTITLGFNDGNLEYFSQPDQEPIPVLA